MLMSVLHVYLSVELKDAFLIYKQYYMNAKTVSSKLIKIIDDYQSIIINQKKYLFL